MNEKREGLSTYKVDWRKLFSRFRKVDFVLVLLILALFVVAIRNNTPPVLAENTSPVSSIALISGDTASLISQPKGTVLVFWATWCPPCQLELARLQIMIDAKEIDPASVVAISSLEDQKLVEQTIKERKYSFRVAADLNGELKDQFRVSGTPTIYFVKPDLQVSWSTSGVSPTLEQRVSSFLGNTDS